MIIETYKEYLNYAKDYKGVKQTGITDILVRSDYLDNNIYENIINNIQNRSYYEYNFANTNIKLYLCYKKTIRKEKFIIHYTNFLLYLFNKINPAKRELKLILICSNFKKTFPLDNILTPYHVNSGVSWVSYNDKGGVIVYRKEEMIKVLTHELIHFFNIDDKNSYNQYETILNKKLNIECKSININESFVDSLACYINIHMFSYFTNTSIIDNILNESKFIINQASMIYNRVNYDKKVCEKTHVASYYILKAIIYLNLGLFIKYLETNKYKLLNVREYIQILLKNYDKDINKIKTFKYKKHRTMKMSYLDILK